MTQPISTQRIESLGPAERLIETLMTHSDHLYHGRPGVVRRDIAVPAGVRWSPVTRRGKTVLTLKKDGRRTVKALLGTLRDDGSVVDARGRVLGEYRAPGLFPEVAAWLYGKAAEVWRMDNELAARWASWAFAQEHRDLKVILAALMLVQSRCGDPVIEDGEVLFADDDYREIGEAMCLLRRRDGRDLNPRLLLRVGEILALPQIASINRRLGFGRSGRSAPMGRYHKAVTRWLRQRERNPKMLHGLVRAGFRTTVMKLARRVGYKPTSSSFFEILRWKQKQAEDGRRTMAIGAAVSEAESWTGLSEAEICQRIVQTRPDYKRIVGLLPAEIGLTRAIVAAAVESGSFSDTDLIILTPTLDELGLLEVPVVGDRWLAATEKAESQRAANIAERLSRRGTAQKLQDAADRALQRSLAEDVRGLKVYVAVDISASMSSAIEKAKTYLTSFLQGFPLDKLVVAVFNSTAREVVIRHPSKRGVEHAFKGFRAGGGTNHAAAIEHVFAYQPPAADEDALFLFVGDQQQHGTFVRAIQQSQMSPVAFGFLYVPGNGGTRNRAVEGTAEALEIPCFRISEDMFGDAYAVGRTLRNLIAATPVGSRSTQRRSLLTTILETELLARPIWA
jgi:hypothetical protein